MTDTTAGEAWKPLYDRLGYLHDLEGLARMRQSLKETPDWHDRAPINCNSLARLLDTIEAQRIALAAQPSASVEALIADARAKMPDAGPGAIARHLYTYLAANPDMSNALWLIQGLKDVIGRERTEQSRIMGDFKDAAPGAAAVAAHDSFLRANPHLNESDLNVRA